MKFIILSVLTALIHNISTSIRHMLMNFSFIDKSLLVGGISVMAAIIISAIF
ncbi:MAG: hypothetical protein ACTS73_03400 [Arsenophonus sp. NEOnobi-MAG3]